MLIEVMQEKKLVIELREEWLEQCLFKGKFIKCIQRDNRIVELI